VIRLDRLAVVVFLWVCLQVHPVSACRYNVRDTGFVDLGAEPYYLYGYVREDTPADVNSSFREISYVELAESNIRIEIINIDRQKEHPAVKYVDLNGIEFFPAAVLVSPDGQTLAVPVTKPDEPFKRTLFTGLEDIVCSPGRDEIIRQVTDSYAVILLIEGLEQQENEKARVKILPEEAYRIAHKGVGEVQSIELEVTDKPVYKTKKLQNANLFGFIPGFQYEEEAVIDATTGAVEGVNAPAWSVFAVPY